MNTIFFIGSPSLKVRSHIYHKMSKIQHPTPKIFNLPNKLKIPYYWTLDSRLKIVKGDITQQHVDAIVNASNITLLGGHGVDGAIHQAAGPSLLEECKTLGGCPTGSAKITQGYNLPAKWIIHAVGPIWNGGQYKEAELLANCYRNSLKLAKSKGVQTIAFPLISAGAYRFPKEDACAIAIREILDFLKSDSSIKEVSIICFNDDLYEICKIKLSQK